MLQLTLLRRKHGKVWAGWAGTDLFSFFQVCQHHDGRRLLLPNHAPKVSHRLQLGAWDETDASAQRKEPNPARRSRSFTLSRNEFALLFKTLRGGRVNNMVYTSPTRTTIIPTKKNKHVMCSGLLHRCRTRLCSPSTGGRRDSAPLWNDHLWKRGEAPPSAFRQFSAVQKARADIDCRRRLSLTHMAKCWGICFSLCCALCSPPQRTRGGSNTAATVKKGDNPREIRINPQHRGCKRNVFIARETDAGAPQWAPPPTSLTLNSSLKSLPSSAERIRYSSSRESRGMGKYLLDGEGDLGRRTTVCSPAFRGIYDRRAADISLQGTLQPLIAPAKTSWMAVKISYFWARLTDMVSSVVNMLLHETVSTQDSLLFFFSLSPLLSLNGSLHAPKAHSHVKLFHLLGFQILRMFHVYKDLSYV